MSDPDTTEPSAPERPVLRVLTPSASPEEIAAVTAVVAAMSAGSGEPPVRPRREWAAPARMHRRPMHTGRGAWRASALPR